MKAIIISIAMALGFAPAAVLANAEPGKAAPDFTVTDTSGKTHKLADYKGKWLVLEWFNKDCPYVKKHYGSGNMQKIQKSYTDKGVVWLSVNSSAKGKEGYQDAMAADKTRTENKSAANALLLDTEGTMGKAYGAKTTPHMFVINPEGKIAYAGAIDDNDSADPKVINKSKNYVSMALDASLATPPQKILTATSRPYGCGVKY
ncbi:MAG: thioredoxin family protein [Pseudobdellovibrionaceae bacterium]